MFKKLLAKAVGKVLAPIVDDLVKRELDKRTAGAFSTAEAAASKIEDAANAVKRIL